MQDSRPREVQSVFAGLLPGLKSGQFGSLKKKERLSLRELLKAKISKPRRRVVGLRF